MSRNFNNAHRSGMVLLIMMVLMATVGLTAMTFILTTTQFKNASRENVRDGRFTIDPDALLHDAIMQILRGTNGSGVLSEETRSLLGDMYGTSGANTFNGTLRTGGEKESSSDENETSDENEKGLVIITGSGLAQYCGHVITCIDPTKSSYRRSTVAMGCSSDGATLYCLPFWDGKEFDSQETTFLVNPLPFQGNSRDYDAFDDNNRFIAWRNSATGRIEENYRSFRGLDNDYYLLNDSDNRILVDADNDGYNDSYWLDFGMPIMTTPHGAHFRPMFGVVIEDMDGKLNINAAGDLNYASRDSQKVGRGMGPAEIAWQKVVGSSMANDLYELRMSANGNTTEADENPLYDGKSVRGGWFTNFTNTSDDSSILRTPMDILGLRTDSVSNGNYCSTLHGTSEDLACYNLDLGPGRVAGLSYCFGDKDGVIQDLNHDMPFSPSELAAVLCRYDIDSPFLPQRLKNVLEDHHGKITDVSIQDEYKSSRIARLITTESWDIPVFSNNSKKIERKTENICRECTVGYSLDLMRAASFADDDWDEEKQCFPRRQSFMETLFLLVKQYDVKFNDNSSTNKDLAQWCANVVDFLDADSIITPFDYSKVSESTDNTWVYGCEQPEILLYSTLAVHSRNTEMDVKLEDGNYLGGKYADYDNPQNENDTTIYEKYPHDENEPYIYTSKDGKETDLTAQIKDIISKGKDSIKFSEKTPRTKDFDQYLRPQGSLFVSLYRPENGNGDDSSSRPVQNDIYESDTWNINLGKTTKSTEGTGETSSSVWRLVLTDSETANSGTEGAGTGSTGTGSTGTGTTSQETGSLKRDETTDSTFNSRVSLVLNFANITTADGITNENVRVFSVNNSTSSTDAGATKSVDPLVMKVGDKRLIGPEGRTVFKFNDPGECTDSSSEITPATEINSSSEVDFLSVPAITQGEEGTNKFRFSLTETFDKEYGPDNSSSSDFRLSNNLRADEPFDSNLTLGHKSESKKTIHLQRLADPTRVYNHTTNPYITVDTMEVDLTIINARTEQLEEGMGVNPTSLKINKRALDFIWRQGGNASSDVVIANIPTTLKEAITPSNTAWLGWINRPAVNALELLGVTNRCASELLYYYRTDSGYLPAWENDTFKRFLGTLRVPSAQFVTPLIINKDSLTSESESSETGGQSGMKTQDFMFGFSSMYREPGKININTITDERVLQALLNKDSISNFESWMSTRNSSPYHPINAEGKTLLNDSNVNSWFTETAASASTEGSTSETDLNPTDRTNLYRIMNLATTRSNVYAVWVTMGFFECDEDGNFADTPLELGYLTGDVHRYRAFYLIDRTIPVGYEHGKSYNADQTILLKRRLP